jgi:acyl carrier protein
MSQETLLTSIQDSIRDVVNNQKLVIEPASKLISDLGLESIDFLDLSSEIENTIGFELDFKEVVEYIKQSSGGVADIKAVTVQNLIDFIATKQA